MRLEELRGRIEALRTEARRRERLAALAGRQAVRADLPGMPTLEEVLAAPEPPVPAGATFDDLRWFRDSATEVRLGYAASARQSIDFTDGSGLRTVTGIDAARELWREGWEPGTPAARGVRIHPVGSRAERVVAAGELHVEAGG